MYARDPDYDLQELLKRDPAYGCAQVQRQVPWLMEAKVGRECEIYCNSVVLSEVRQCWWQSRNQYAST